MELAKQLLVQISPDLWKKLKEVSLELKTSYADIVRRALSEYFSNLQK